MTTVIVHHTVADLDAWLPGFAAHDATRKSHGCTSAAVYTDAGNPNAVTVVLEFPSAGNAKAFRDDPSLKDAMSKAGVTSAPDIHIVEPVPAPALEGVS